MTGQPTTKQVSFDELVTREARKIASEMIEKELDRQNMPMPKEASLSIHIDAILSGRPDIQEIARKRVEARQDAYSESLLVLGIGVEIGRVIDIEL